MSYTQNIYKKWYFNNSCGLDFIASPPTVLTGSLGATNGAGASIADNSGNILFYTDGTTVWNQTHSVMANGTNLDGGGPNNHLQDAIIIKKPGTSTIYYIFTTSNSSFTNINTGFKYSAIDMTLASGNGSVTIKNYLLNTSCSGGVSYAKHCNGIDYWIISHENNNSNFDLYLLTSAGIQTTNIVQNIVPNVVNYNTVIKVSPNSKRLVLSNSTASCTLFDFDNATGLLSNPIVLSGNFTKSYLEFSPDCSKLYGAGWLTYQIEQYDLCAGSVQNIQNSRTTFTSSSITAALQLGTDGKIYISNFLQGNLGVINNPNGLGTTCNYVDIGQSTLPNYSWGKLPNFTLEYQFPTLPSFSFTSNSLSCQAGQFQSPFILGATVGTCVVNQFTLQSLYWDFGDPLSGSANTSTLTNPTHTFTSVGNYSVNLILDFGCGYGIDTIKQVVNITNSCFSISSQSITCASLGSASITNIGSTSGPFSFTWMPSNQTGSVASNLNPGTYTVNVFDASIIFTHTLSTTFIPLVPLSGNIANSASLSCFGASTGTGAITNLAGGSSQQYFSWFNGTTSYTSSSTNSLSAGLWTVSVTDALTACSFSNTIFISQPSAQNLILSASSPTACNGSNIVLSGTNSGGTPFSTGSPYTYTWTNGPTSNTNSVSEATSGTYIYTLSSSDANSCLTSNTIALNFIANPTLSVSNLFICPLSVGTLTVSGATNYTWASTSLSLTGTSFTDAPSSSQQYTVVGEMSGCSSQAVASMVLYNNPIPTLNTNSPLCNGDNLTMTGLGGNSFQWSGPNLFSSNSSTVNINPVSNVNAGVYTLTVTATTGCTASVSQTIVVNPTPTLSVSGSTVCTSQTLHLSASSFAGSSYEWSGPQSFTSTLQNPFFTNPLLTNTGTYTVKVTSVDACTNTAITTASVINPPSLTTQLSSNTLCSQAFNGSPNTITLTAGGANMYTLVTVPDMNISNPSLPSTQLTAIPPNTGVASATLSGSNGVCTVTTSLTFTILPNPTVSIISPTPVICAGQTYTYTNQGATSYTWSNHAPGVTTYSTGQMAVLNPSVNSVFSVVGGSLGCFSTIKTTTITVNPLPIFYLAPTSPTICLNNKVVLQANGNANAYNWSPFTGLNSVSGTTVLASPTSLQSYTAIGSLNTCTSSAFITVSVVPLPNPIASTLKPELCLNELITLVGKGGVDYIWHGPADLMFAGQTVTFVASNPSFSGTYTLTVSDENGCKASNQVGVKINLLPSADLLISRRNACVPFTSYFKFNVPGQTNSNIDAYWQLGNQTFTDKQFSYNFTTAGNYSIFAFYTDTLTSCKNKGTFFVDAYPLPVADFTYEPKQPVEGLDEVSFINTSSGESLNKFNWYFINNNGYRSENENTSYLFNEVGEYPVAMVVQNKWGCSDTITKAIKIESDFNFYVPNAFTPNDDNLNDVFLPVVRGVKLFELMIFDRWGKMIFSTDNTQQGWDGYYNGEPAKQDVYTWKVVLSTNSGEAKVYTGQVLLTR